MSPNSSSVVHLPDGQTFVAQPVFGGLFFKSVDAFHRQTPFPAGWTIVLHTEVDEPTPSGSPDGVAPDGNVNGNGAGEGGEVADAEEDREDRRVRKWTRPTLQNDTIFIASISNPSSMDFEPAKSMSRQVAMMLWVSLYWYFQQPAPAPYLADGAAARHTPEAARPRGEWRIRIQRDGVFRSRNLVPKLERMGLIATLDTAVGTSTAEDDAAAGWDTMYVTRRAFWQIPTGLFLFTLQPRRAPASPPGSPPGSRPTSPPLRSGHAAQPSGSSSHSSHHLIADLPGGTIPLAVAAPPAFPLGPYYSSSHLPTYYPPPVLQYRLRDDGLRCPVRPKPPRMGEIFYSRYVPSVGQYLSFRVASTSPQPVPHLGPSSASPAASSAVDAEELLALSDDGLLRRWLGRPRVQAFWGAYDAGFLPAALRSRHSFPAIGLWDGVPFGYFELYWVKEDALGRRFDAADFDRGLHVLVGEDWARGRVPAWLSSLVHYCWQADYRTMNVCLEPRVDNERCVFPPHI